ncbi:MAG: hypothetical protein KC464_03840 [Myxococcales bacterium]|nr:hypothetical protein [Myxococcales bacterium]
MTDDWSTPTGERMPFEVGNDDATPDSDLLLAVEERDLRLLDAFFHELALDASNDPTPNTPEEQAEDDAMMAWAQRLMATRPGNGGAAR